MAISKMNIRGKLIAGFLFLVGIFLSIGSFAYFDSAEILLRITHMDEQTVRTLHGAEHLEAKFGTIGELFSSAASFGDEEKLEKALKVSQEFTRTLMALERVSSQDHDMLSELKRLFSRYREDGEKIARAMIAGQSLQEISETLMGFSRLTKALNMRLVAYKSTTTSALNEQITDIRARAHDIQKVILLIAGFSVFFGIAIAFVMGRAIVTPLHEMSDIAKKIAQGDLSATLLAQGRDEIGMLSESFRVMVEGLRKADSQRLKMARISAMVENAPSGMMFVDNAFRVTYLNPAALRMFKKLEDLLPCRADEVLGHSLDIFHPDLKKIKDMIADPKNLPYASDIKLKDEVIGVVFSAVYDDQKNRMGTFVPCRLVTTKTRVLETLKETTTALSHESTHLSNASRQMGGNLETVSIKSSCAGRTSQATTGNAEVVASSSEEMAATIKEISKNVQEATQMSAEAVEKTKAANRTICKLGESSHEIGQVIRVINSIATLTNQLALNATIEAARSGDAGKGFAVVANEVKGLAKQTSDATAEIHQKISAIQQNTEEAVLAIEEIGTILSKNNDISTSIAGAIEQQSVTTSEISSNAGEAAKGANDVVATIEDITSATTDTAKEAEAVLMASQSLSGLARNLQGLIDDLSGSQKNGH